MIERPINIKPSLPDGLYRVVTKYLVAGFSIEDGKITECAPILRNKIQYWLTIAERIA